MTAVDRTAVTLFVPLVFATVAELSSLARDLEPDADGLAGRPSLLRPGSSRLLPALGRLNVVHATNVLLLANTFLLVSALDASLLRHVLALIVLAVWLQLPLVEVADYTAITRAGRYPLSLYFHVASTLALVWYTAGHVTPDVVALEEALLELHFLAVLHGEQLRPLLVFLGLLVGSAVGFLHLLARDEPAGAAD